MAGLWWCVLFPRLPYSRVSSVAGLKQKKEEAQAAPACADEDRGAILFVTTFAGASREAANACRDATRLLEALRLPFEARDVFLHKPFAAQFRRLARGDDAATPFGTPRKGGASPAPIRAGAPAGSAAAPAAAPT